jgi:beta-lactam-binding protein with PASTA domain
MRVEADRSELGDDTIEERTRAEGEWAVPEQYRVDEAPEHSGTTVVKASPSATRRLPLRRAGIPLAAALLALGSLALIPLLTSPPEGASESALDQPAPVNLGGPATPAPSKAKTTSGKAKKVEVPDVQGSAVAAARRALQKAGLKGETRTVDAEEKPGTVLQQEPGAGERVARRSVVVLLVADAGSQSQAAGVSMPDLVGLRADRAGRLARAEGLRVEVRFVRSSDEAGAVVDQQPAAGESVARGSVVELEIAKMARPVVTTVRVPRLEGLQLTEAKARLSSRGLRWSVEKVSSSRPAGVVLQQLDRPGAAVEKGTRVPLEVSSGPRLVAVHDVIGLDVVDARQELEAAGFVVIVTESPTADPAEDGIVLDQSPASGTRLREGTEVTIYVGMAG